MKLLECCRQTARVKHFSLKTERTYLYWFERVIRFRGIRHPLEMAEPEVESFLTELAVRASQTPEEAVPQVTHGLVLLSLRDPDDKLSGHPPRGFARCTNG